MGSLGMEAWNAVGHHLTDLTLIAEGAHRLPGASSHYAFGKTIYLTDTGAKLMTWYSRREANPAPPTPSVDPLLSTPLAILRYGSM